jgi:hypothetical protein
MSVALILKRGAFLGRKDWNPGPTPIERPPGKAGALTVKPAVAIVRAVKPIAILRIMMSIVLASAPSH